MSDIEGIDEEQTEQWRRQLIDETAARVAWMLEHFEAEHDHGKYDAGGREVLRKFIAVAREDLKRRQEQEF